MFDFVFKRKRGDSFQNRLNISGRDVPLTIIRNLRARRYVLRVDADGSARLTIPRRGSIAEGCRFAERQTGWLEQQLDKLSKLPPKNVPWRIGTEILYRGEMQKLEDATNGNAIALRFADEIIPVSQINADLRESVSNHMWKLAAKEFPPRVFQLAGIHQLTVRRVTVRNQRTRWGSCSRRGTISLNWRLIQTPPFVFDYIILHELMHLRQMNHSTRFWREVESVCPGYKTAEKWLKEHRLLTR